MRPVSFVYPTAAGRGSPGSGRTCKDEARGTRRDRPGYVVLPDAFGARTKSGNERNHRHDYPAQRKFFDCCTNGRPEDFDMVAAAWIGSGPSGEPVSPG